MKFEIEGKKKHTTSNNNNAEPKPNQIGGQQLPSPLETARAFIDRGWAPIPIRLFDKKPDGLLKWNEVRVTRDNVTQYFAHQPGNVGVLLGDPSGGLTDIDLDCPEAVRMAPKFLPPTLTFGRKTNPCSHWLYIVREDIKTDPFRADAAADPTGKSKTLLEIRSTRSQTVFPGSTHKTGELIEFDDASLSPLTIAADDLMRACAKLAAATILVRSGMSDDDACSAVERPETISVETAAGCAARKRLLPEVEPTQRPRATAVVGRTTGRRGGRDDFARYNDAHPREYPKSNGTCPACGHNNCFGQLADNAARWCCFSADHGAEHGGLRGDGCWHGDALDLDAHEAGIAREDMLARFNSENDTLVINAFIAKLDENPKRAFEAAFADTEILQALHRTKSANSAGFELVKCKLVKAGLTKGEVASLSKAAAQTSPPQVSSQTRSQALSPSSTVQRLPTINVHDEDLSANVRDAKSALLAANTPPTVFLRGGSIAFVTNNGAASRIDSYTNASFQVKLSEVAFFVVDRSTTNKKGDLVEKITKVYPPRSIVDGVLSLPPPELPELRGICSVPYFGHDGLVTAPGYSPVNKLVLIEDGNVVVPLVSVTPTEAEVDAAKKLLLEELLVDFPYETVGDRAHHLALLIQPFLKCIDGPTPMYIVEAPEAGTGKTLAVIICALIALGIAMPVRPLPQREEEREKAFLALLLAGSTFVALDNAKGIVGGPTLESALTTTAVSGRVLGKSQDVTVHNGAVWVMTANNVDLTRDMTRRTVRIRLNANLEKPEEGRSFKHENLLEWVREHRGELIHAILTLIQHWYALGRPMTGVTKLGSFESWSLTLGGILKSAGIDGFLAPETKMSSADPLAQEVREFIVAWYVEFRDSKVTAKELLDKVCAKPVPTYGSLEAPKEADLMRTVLGGVSGRAQRLGNWLRKNNDRVIGNHTLKSTELDRTGVRTYQLVKRPVVNAAPTAPETVARDHSASPTANEVTNTLVDGDTGDGSAGSAGTAGGVSEPPDYSDVN